MAVHFIDKEITNSQYMLLLSAYIELYMKFLFLVIGIVMCTSTFAVEKTIDQTFSTQVNQLMVQQSASYSIVNQFEEISLDRDLTEQEATKFNQAVCKTVAIENQLSDLLKSNLTQAKLVLDNDQLSDADISNMRTASISYELAKELIGTSAECK